MAGPTIIVHGTEEQKKEHLPRILSGESQWCQGFSEPGSGSDLASLQTRAVRDGDDFVINGSKIWTSGAQRANWMFMLARTDPDAPKHRGISYFLMDFTSPGHLSVQPLVQMSGQAGFNQVFFDNVRVPGEERRRRGQPRLVHRHDDARLRAQQHRQRRRHPPRGGLS